MFMPITWMIHTWRPIAILVVAAAGVALSSGGEAALAANQGDELDRRVQEILQQKCVMCHDSQKASAGGGVDNLLKLDELASGYGDPAQPDKSSLYLLISGNNPRMPKRRMNNIDWKGPLSSEDRDTILQWLRRGGPDKSYLGTNTVARRLIPEQERIEWIARDLKPSSKSARKSSRYLTLTNWHNHRELSDDDLEQFRIGVVKLLNSVSRNPQVLGLDTSKAARRVVAVDPDRTIFRFDLDDLGWTNTEWDKIARHDPYGLAVQGEVGRTIATATSSELPFLRADWFVFAVSQPPLYHDLVGIPATLAELEKGLGLDRLAAIREKRVRRAGFDHSRVSVNNRLLERIPLPSRNGGYHLSYDFATNTDEQNLKENPLGPVDAIATKFAFRHDGGEVIFTLPNGFQAYVLVTGAGLRIDTAPQPIVSDNTMPGGVIINGISCISCHYEGMKPERGDIRLDILDEVRPAAEQNFRRFSEADRRLIAEIYPSAATFKGLLEQDRTRFLTAMADARLEQRGSDEPVRLLFDHFTRNLTLETVAADFGLAPDECRDKLRLEGETRQLLARLEQGGLKRQLYLTEFHTMARLIGAGDPRDFEKLPFPYFGDKVEVAATNKSDPVAVVEQQQAKRDQGTLGRTGIDVLDAENRNGRMQVQLTMVDDRRSFVEDETIRFHVRSNIDCFLTVLSVDPVGEIKQLLPNKWHPQFRLKAGQTATLATPEMQFDFVAEPPHGRTQLKVIASRKPLDLTTAVPQDPKAPEILGFGNITKGAKGIGVRLKSNLPAETPNAAEVHFDKLDKLFAPDEWATATMSFVTREPRR